MRKKQKRILNRIIISATLVLINIIVFEIFKSVLPIVKLLCYLLPFFIIGYDIIIKSVKGIFFGKILDENFLMTIASVGALIIGVLKTGDFLEAVAVMLLYQTGELFQSIATEKSRKSILKANSSRPDYANLEKDGKIFKVSPEEVNVGDIILVKTGEKIPLDGIIIDSTAYVEKSLLTGESFPIESKTGDEVLSGSISVSGVIKVKVIKAFKDSTYMKITELTENAGFKKSSAEAFISKFAKVYTPTVCALALLLFLVPPLFNLLVLNVAPNFLDWLYRALTFLVISCPCALVISVPLAIFAGLGGVGKLGIVVKSSNRIETLSNVKTVALDKTGTLTYGKFKVKEVYAVEEESELIKLTAYAENSSIHPIAKSVVDFYGKDIDQTKVSQINELKGLGITAKVFNKDVAVGNAKLMKNLKVNFTEIESLDTIIFVAIDGRFAGYFIISDEIKPDSYQAINDLNNLKIKTVMLTGDNYSWAKNVTEQLKIDSFKCELLPNDKVIETQNLIKNTNGAVLYAGDGINDAPVIKLADVGVAMGGMGSDLAVDSADVIIMDDNPKKIVTAIKHARKIIRIVKQNIIFSIGIKVCCLFLSALGLMNMWFSVFADVGVMVLAVLNSMRALKVKI